MIPLTIKNKTLGEGKPRICIPITGQTETGILEAAGQIRSLPHDMVEWRADYYESVTEPACVRHILAALTKCLPDSLLLFTFRTRKEGGSRELPEPVYLDICRNVAESGLADLLDLELFTGSESTQTSPAGDHSSPLMSLIVLAHEHNCRVILSNHDFKQTPAKEELIRRLTLMERLGADLAKIAVMPQNEQDVLTLLSATRIAADSLGCPVITMSMGPLGVISRISGAFTGSCLTFGTAKEASAPGQLPADILKNILDVL